MKLFLAAAISLLITSLSIGLITPSAAGDEVTTPPTLIGKQVAVDCTKEVWPHFSPSCLRNADQATQVRMVAVSRR